MNVNSRQALLMTINKISFAINDATLYLDTHPCDQVALAFIKENIALRNDALRQFADNFGPLTIDSFSECDSSWTWINEPMPWEGGHC